MDKIYVTRTFMPPLEEYETYLEKIWQSRQLTNQGPLLVELEEKLQSYLQVENLHFVTNGTLALQVAMQALDINQGDIITTPFSYVATTSSILWERCRPLFVDIDPETLCIDADKIEAAVTSDTKAIMAVHVFGNPCDVEKIEVIAKKHSLKVIYDAAHAFGVEYKGKSLLSYGDISTCSFHATKLFHTIEGGAVIAKEKNVSDRIELIKRFGHDADNHSMLGINAKASEFQAAMGLCNLKHIDDIIQERKRVFETYGSLLSSKIKTLTIPPQVKYNYGYYPAVMENEQQLLATIHDLNSSNIFPRRYFYPSLNELPYISDKFSCPISEKISRSIMCLPMYGDLADEDIRKICEIVNHNAK